jgi:signal transduction histidine kinase/streptogramin lyase
VLHPDTGMPFESVQSIAEDATGQLWAVSQDGRLGCAREGKWKMLRNDIDWPGHYARSVASDAHGGVLVGTLDNGLLHWNGKTWLAFNHPGGFGRDGIRSLLVARNGEVWIGAGAPNRLFCFTQGVIKIITNAPPLGVIRALAQDDRGTVWIGTSEGQVLRIKAASEPLEPVVVDPLLSVRCLLATQGGHLWIGYAGDGLGHLLDQKCQRLTTLDGLSDDFISQLLADDRGNLWINSNRGLARVAISELEEALAGRIAHVNSRAFGVPDSLPAMQPSRDFCPNAFCARDGHLWYALHGGLLAVQPERMLNNRYPPPVYIERVEVDENVVAARNANSPMQFGLATDCLNLSNSGRKLRIGPDHRKVEIDFVALSFASPENVQFRYRLQPFDADWVDGHQNRQVIYPHLPPGEYEFHVIACNNTGLWNDAGARLAFFVAPHFWETWWFKTGVGLATVLLGGGIAAVMVRRRYWQRIRRLEARRALEQERSRIARDIHDDLGSNLTRISLLSQPARGGDDGAFVAENLAQIHQTARELTHAMGEVVWAVNPEHDTFDSLANYASNYAQNLLGTAGIRCRIEMPLQLSAQPLSAETRHNLFLAFKEALNNVLKHSGATEVRITLTPGDTGFELLVADNGRGLVSARPGFPEADGASRPATGNGLNNMHTRMREIGGECDVQSAPGQGTRICFRVISRPKPERA